MSQDDGGIAGFLFYMFIVYPVTSWLLKSFKGNRGLCLAVGFLGCIALGKTVMEIEERGPNFYATLYVPPTNGFDEMVITRSSTVSEIRKAFKKNSLEYHPDKNKSPEAGLQFERIKQAYEVLANQESRMVYNKFGPSRLEKNHIIDGNEILLEIAIYHVSWAVLVFILTLGKASNSARNYIYCGQIAVMIVEVSLTLQDVSLPEWFLPTTTEFEMVLLLHSLFPAFMNGCRIICSFYYIDLDELTKNTLISLRDSHEEILERLKSIQQQLDEGGGKAGFGSVVKPIGDRVNEMSPPTTEQLKVSPMGNIPPSSNSNTFAVVALFAYIAYYTWSQ